MKYLSCYTLAKNCTDATDCQSGIDELKDYMRKLDDAGKPTPKTVYIRFYRLTEKIKKFKPQQPAYDLPHHLHSQVQQTVLFR